MYLNKEEQVFLRLLMRDAWYDCDMRNKSQSERKLFLQIQSKLSNLIQFEVNACFWYYLH